MERDAVALPNVPIWCSTPPMEVHCRRYAGIGCSHREIQALAKTKPTVSGVERIQTIQIAEDHRNGLRLRSIEYDNAGSDGWRFKVEVPKHVQYSSLPRARWGEDLEIRWGGKPICRGSVVINGMTRKGVWRYETPTLLFDPQDIAARRWKLFVSVTLRSRPYQKGNRPLLRTVGSNTVQAIPQGLGLTPFCLIRQAGN